MPDQGIWWVNHRQQQKYHPASGLCLTSNVKLKGSRCESYVGAGCAGRVPACAVGELSYMGQDQTAMFSCTSCSAGDRMVSGLQAWHGCAGWYAAMYAGSCGATSWVCMYCCAWGMRLGS